ncbi:MULTISPECIES: MerR family transcriptional regulator [unclassified Pseudoalteromonas]|jgi:DNA-binding transcriptional MerR regulator|uniref:MerR family transcriptional regulator n=1 Tax=unclassified Pseudoalteromonas TaxID=194690 RepID=UPI0016048131|nr:MULTISPECIES: MerR family transcriptional regulator [unclassified Pseudoalteromonas]MBB1351802.1 MerR family transcriptional regulator [Pseudoalteromonas sp. SG45-3]MBB1358707.1 MerR family transcriptional regulator [Pseudoalteromonas sp. SG45-6]
MKVAELAKSLGTTADTVRYYSRLGLLKPAKSVNGYKLYSNKEVSRLKFILSARNLGFSVADIKQILNESEDGKSACPLVRSLIKERLEETEKQFQAMLALRGKMSSALSQWEEMEDKAPTANMVCHLIENFEQIKKA